MTKFIFLILLNISLALSSLAQYRHFDFIGAGHTYEVQVTTSSNTPETRGENTVDGFPIQSEKQLREASRFLAQCTFGADMPMIQMVAAMGYEAWLEEQFNLPQILLTPAMRQHHLREFDEEDNDELDPNWIYAGYMRSAWMHNALTAADVLRQRMVFILSQIWVINTKSDLFEDLGQFSSSYYDMLGQHAFGNYRNLLEGVTYSPAMGLFLSHFNNPKADPANNIHPDENYAREIMQLFSIGLWELDAYGNRKYDAEGQFIPTYSNDDIKEFAQVFTGLSDGRPNGRFGESDDEFAAFFAEIPMKMYDAYHDKSEKRLLNGVVLPAGQTGGQDIRQTLDHLSGHSNTAPFIARALIQFMTTSNPSGAYIQRVASVFNPMEPNNFQQVIKAILLDPEARTCNRTETYTFGKLREPLVRHLNYLKAFPIAPNENGNYIFNFECLDRNIGQSPFNAPSVFNFFLPDYSPQGPINQSYMVAPEFQILNAPNAIGLVNEADILSVRRHPLMECYEEEENEEEEGEGPSLYQTDYSSLQQLAVNPAELINYLDILLANGLLSHDTKAIIEKAVRQLPDAQDRIKMATYLIMISPDYAILK